MGSSGGIGIISGSDPWNHHMTHMHDPYHPVKMWVRYIREVAFTQCAKNAGVDYDQLFGQHNVEDESQATQSGYNLQNSIYQVEANDILSHPAVPTAFLD
ncbi:unnamed protein product [Absidia cylindrospora]